MPTVYSVLSFNNSFTFLLGLSLFLASFFVMVPKAQAAVLTEPQIQSILNLLASFGADQSVIDDTELALRGGVDGPVVEPQFKIAVVTPNGEKAFDVAGSNAIEWQYIGISSVDIGLYKNDQWVAWIKKGVVPPYSSGSMHYLWNPSDPVVYGVGDTLNQKIYKIYVLGKKNGDEGYVSSLSVAPFMFVDKEEYGALPTCSVTYTPSIFVYGQPYAVEWISSGAGARSYTLYDTSTGKTIFGPYSPEISGSLSAKSFKDLAPGTYIRKDTVTGKGGTGYCSQTLRVVSAAEASKPSCTITYTPSAINEDTRLTVEWDAKNATSRSYSFFNPSGKLIYITGSLDVSGRLDNAYTANLFANPGVYVRTDTVFGPGGQETCSAKLQVLGRQLGAAAPSMTAAVAGTLTAPFVILTDVFSDVLYTAGLYW